MQRGVATLPDRRDDVRMVVADGRTHLAGREVEDPLARGIPHVATLRLLDDFRIGIPTVADQVITEILAGSILRTH